MSDYILFQMSRGHRERLIARHNFYVSQAQGRLLSQFKNMSAEAERAADDWLAESHAAFNPDFHDPSDFMERANDVGIEFYGLLDDMLANVRLAVISGMFHEWEKNLRDWIVNELGHFVRSDSIKMAVWSARFEQITELLECLDWPIRNRPYYSGLNACRLVVNVYKHGYGNSLVDLRKDCPEYLRKPFAGILEGSLSSDFSDRINQLVDHTYLVISDQDLLYFSLCIVDFWSDLPESVYQSQIKASPKWLEKIFRISTT